MKSFTTLLQGALLGAGMVFYMGFCFGAFNYLQNGGLHYHALVAWMSVLALVGFALRRWVWRQRSHVWKITGIGFLLCMLAPVVLGLVSGEGGRMLSLEQGGTMMFLFVPWFWLPFAIGLLAGGFRRKTGHADPSEHPTIV